MREPLRMLIVEDSADDAALLVRELERAGYQVQARRVETAAAMAEALDGGEWDLVASDYALPSFSGLEALRLVQQRGVDLPFIVVSGAVTEETAVEAMRAGADDYVLKGNLARLGPAVARELREAKRRRERRRAESELVELKERSAAELRRSRDQLEAILRSTAEGIVAQDAQGTVIYANDAAARAAIHRSGDGENCLLELYDESGHRLSAEELPARVALAEGRSVERILRGTGAAGDSRWYAVTATPIFDDGQQAWMAITLFRDVTEQRRAEVHARLLAEAGAALGASLDCRSTLDTLARLSVPVLGEWCVLEVTDGDAPEQGQRAGAHADPALTKTVRALAERPEVVNALFGSRRALATGELELRDPIDLAAIRREVIGWPELGVLFGEEPLTAVTLPLSARERRMGTMTLVAPRARVPRLVEELAAARELARRGSLALENAELYQRARQAVAIRDEFLSIASHELRTPLTTLLLQLERIRTAEPGRRLGNKSWEERVDQAVRQANRMAGLIESMLDVSRVSAGRLILHREPVDLRELIQQSVARLEPNAAAAGCAVTVEVEGTLTGEWDRARLEQVLANLLSNAFKYGSGAPVEVRARSDGDRVRVSVRDHGFGIAEQDRARIFARFERAVSPRHYGGLGLGLFIARQIVEGHGGVVEVDSVPGQGATFTVTLPCHPTHAEAPTVH